MTPPVRELHTTSTPTSPSHESCVAPTVVTYGLDAGHSGAALSQPSSLAFARKPPEPSSPEATMIETPRAPSLANSRSMRAAYCAAPPLDALKTSASTSPYESDWTSGGSSSEPSCTSQVRKPSLSGEYGLRSEYE